MRKIDPMDHVITRMLNQPEYVALVEARLADYDVKNILVSKASSLLSTAFPEKANDISKFSNSIFDETIDEFVDVCNTIPSEARRALSKYRALLAARCRNKEE